MLDALCIATLVWLAIGSARLWRNALSKGHPAQSILLARANIATPFGLIDVAIMFISWAVGQMGSALIAMSLLGIGPGTIEQASANTLALLTGMIAIGQLISTAIGISIIWARYRTSRIFGWQPGFIQRDLRIAGAAFVMIVPLVLLIQWLLALIVPYHHTTLDMLSDSQSGLTILFTWLAAVVVAPICEEVFFRGVLQAWLQRMFDPGQSSLELVINGGWDEVEPLAAAKAIEKATSSREFWLPIVVSAAIFGLVHLGQGAAPIPLFVFGLALGYLYRQTGSLLPCIVLHLSLNGFSMFWFTLNSFFSN